MPINNKTALVTGAGDGMGRAIAKRFADEGASVIIADISKESAQKTIDYIGKDKDRHMIAVCDIASSKDVESMFKQARDRYKQLDILVNNAGIGSAAGDGQDRYMELLTERVTQMSEGKAPTTFADKTIYMGDDGWKRVVEVNLHGTFYCSREAIRWMIDTKTQGSIVNISSTSALNGDGGIHYCASKAAIIGMTRAMAKELAARQIRINAVCPGPTDTVQMQGISEQWRQSIIQSVPLGRMAKPEEIADTALFLASDAGSLYTGQTLACNGGMQML